MAELVNTFRGEEELTAAALQAVVDRHGAPLSTSRTPRCRSCARPPGLLAAVLDLDDVDDAADAVNALLDRYPFRPRLVRLPRRPWAVHARTPQDAGPVDARTPQDAGPVHARAPQDAGLIHWLVSTAALALALWLGERGRCAWGRCAAPGCARYFIDAGRRAPQRYRSTRCGTRLRVAAHRTRPWR
ncbi:CGNR zinc finger domain-containing protein [Streptacidiphilus neutrinimicus]|uniref:CGNR zinc finger domain-containing protein n=1 Tax=Streptacidiphilus neutrinimicus TaxID=105420 RepID=UPI0006938ADD|nr:CGNR zinc finger domain-containing protein [Streptacidiphilus neutrinimicus]